MQLTLRLKTMFAYKSIECLHQLLKSRHLFVVHFIKSINGISNMESREKKRKAILLLAYNYC